MTVFENSESFSREEIDKRKKAIFDSMGKRTQSAILRKGFDSWDPFEEPKHPVEIRKDKTGNTVSGIVEKFFNDFPEKKGDSAYRKIVEEMSLGVITGDDKIKARYVFSMWYKKVLEESGIEEDWT
ncbi:MAG: hypothetical protein RBR53_09880 [Desulforegulaceae bacterium]|nr:hypothetical protein [Desulforegulaceae bacterium]